MRRILPSNAMVLALLLVAILAMALGSNLDNLSTAKQERIRTETEQWEKQQEAERPAKVFWAWAQRFILGVSVLLLVVAVISVGWLYGIRRAVTIGADKRGLFPLLLGRLPVKDGDGQTVGRAWVVHDPNRALGATTSLGDKVDVMAHTPAGLEREQLRITSQAQSVQALAAVASGEAGGNRAGELVSGVIGTAHQLARPLPDVKRSPWEPSHIERLLIEAGEMEGADYE